IRLGLSDRDQNGRGGDLAAVACCRIVVAGKSMRRTVQIAGQVENLFGTLDENLKLFESTLHVTTFFHNDRLTVEGEPAHVDRAVHILDQYNDLVREGRRMDNGAVKALLRVAVEDPKTSLRHILEPGQPVRPRFFGKKSITPRSANQR